MKHITHAVLVAVFAAVGFIDTAFAEDDAAALVQRARVLEEVDKDVEKARPLYLRAWQAGKKTDAGFRAGMRLVALLPKSDTGRRALLDELTRYHGERMSDAHKQQVHDAIAALLEPGQHATTPLGMVYVRPEVPEADTRSPVEQQLQKIFEAHNVRRLPFEKNNDAALRDVDRELRMLGAPARAALLRLVSEGQPDEAYSAAIVLGRLDPAAAVKGYARAMAQGRAKFRRQVLTAAYKIEPREDVSKAIVAECMPLLELDDIRDLHKTLVYLISKHQTKDGLLALGRTEGPWQVQWLEHALREGHAEAVPPLVALVAEGKGGERAIGVLSYAVGRRDHNPSGTSKWTLPLESLETAEVKRLFATLLASPVGVGNANDVFRRLARILHDRKELDALAQDVWRRVLAEPSKEKRDRIMDIAARVRHDGVPALTPSQNLFKSETDWARLALSLPRSTKSITPWMKQSVPLWKAAVREIQRSKPSIRDGIARVLSALNPQHPPEGARDEVLALFESDTYKDRLDHMKGWLWNGAGATGSPRFLKRLLELRDWRSWYTQRHRATRALSNYQKAGGKGLTEFAITVLSEGKMNLRDWAMHFLRRSDDPKAWAHITAAAKDPKDPACYVLVQQIDIRDPRQRALLTGLFDMAETGDNEFWSSQTSLSLRQLLVKRAAELRLKEAVPFLIREYEVRDLRSQHRDKVIEALDAIREHHERLEFFKTWAAGKADAEREIRAMLADPSPTIRRAAVLSWATLVGPRGLSDLLKIAKHDQDTDVRAAALQAIERIAASQVTTATNPTTPKPDKK